MTKEQIFALHREGMKWIDLGMECEIGGELWISDGMSPGKPDLPVFMSFLFELPRGTYRVQARVMEDHGTYLSAFRLLREDGGRRKFLGLFGSDVSDVVVFEKKYEPGLNRDLMFEELDEREAIAYWQSEALGSWIFRAEIGWGEFECRVFGYDRKGEVVGVEVVAVLDDFGDLIMARLNPKWDFWKQFGHLRKSKQPRIGDGE